MAGKLTVVPTPLGNLGDMTGRALAALREADAVCCEDTRVTGKLLAALGVAGVRLERLDEATLRAPAGGAAGEQTGAEAVAARVAAGERIAYASDAGMPGVSDPGAALVAAARRAGVPCEVLPGPSAAVLAYVASGFSCPQWYFGGFFPRKAGQRARLLEQLAGLDAVLLFYESPNRVAGALQAIAEAFPLRQVAACRELTKLHEEVLVAPAPDAAAELARREREGAVLGEFVLAVDAPGAADAQAAADDAQDRAGKRAAELRAEGSRSRKDIARMLQDEFGVSRNVAYALAHGQ